MSCVDLNELARGVAGLWVLFGLACWMGVIDWRRCGAWRGLRLCLMGWPYVMYVWLREGARAERDAG